MNQESEVTACMVTATDNCKYPQTVRIKQCGGFRVFNLQPTRLCPAAYCFDAKIPCPVGKWSETGTEPGCSDNFPQVNIQPRVTPALGKSLENENAQDLRFSCDFESPDNDYFYDVVWKINGDEVKAFTKIPKDNLPNSVQLLETHWKDNYKLGMNVQCSAAVRHSENNVPSPPNDSEVFFAGLKVLNPGASVIIEEGKSISIRYQATVPIPCGEDLGSCSVQFKDLTYHSNERICNTQESGKCGFSILPSNWNDTATLDVEAPFDGIYTSDRLARIVLESTPYQIVKGVWESVIPEIIIVNIQDKDGDVSNSECIVHNDPHFKSFDQRKFDVHLAGEFVLYRHKTLPLEVRGFFEPCGSHEPNRPRCVCGAAVRSGTQIFVWSKCKDNISYQTTRVEVHGCRNKEMRVMSTGNGFKIQLPRGLRVDVEKYGRIKITPSAADFNQTVGLCGNFNGNKDDEYIDPEGKQHSNTCDSYLFGIIQFCVVNKYGITWKITDPAQSFYGYPQMDLGQRTVGRCHCDPEYFGDTINKVTCDNQPPPLCNDNAPDVAEKYCPLDVPSPNRRRKRQADETGNDDEEDVVVMPAFPIYEDTLEFQAPGWTNGWDEDKARNHCEMFFRSSPAYDPCSKVSNIDLDWLMDGCVVDIQLSGTTEWTLSSLEAYKQQCLSEVRKNTTLWMSENGAVSILDQVTRTVCPLECSFRGDCINGACVCNLGWIGDDCSIDSSKPPEVTGLARGGLCNLRDHPCNETLVYGLQFAPSSSLTCRFRQVSIVGESYVKRGDAVYITEAIYRHDGEIICTLTNEARFGTEDGNYPIGYYLSVSNNKELYSDDKLYLPYHSGDFTCKIGGSNARCKNKNLVMLGPIHGSAVGFEWITPSLLQFIGLIMMWATAA